MQCTVHLKRGLVSTFTHRMGNFGNDIAAIKASQTAEFEYCAHAYTGMPNRHAVASDDVCS